MKKLLCLALLGVVMHVHATTMTCRNWRNVAQTVAEARNRGVTEATMVKAISDATMKGALPKDEYENNLGVITAVYHAPSLKDAAPETVGHIAEITCHQAHWEKK